MKKKSIPYGISDFKDAVHQAKKGYGPETITLDKLDKSKNYKVYIHQYSSKGHLDHNTNLSIYKNNKLDKVIALKDNIQSRCVQIATIHNNQVKYDTKEVSQSICKK